MSQEALLLEIPVTDPGDYLEFFAPCDPPTANHQAKRIVKCGGFSKLADKPELRSAREFWTGLLAQYRPAQPFDGPLSLALGFSYPFVKSTTKRDLLAGSRWKVTRPDCSNAAKTVEDILVSLRFMHDDNQVARLVVEKRDSTQPGLFVRIEKLRE